MRKYQKVIFDTETTGLDPYQDEILQFSAINEYGEVLLNTYIKPTRHKSWDNAESIHHISPSMVQNCKTFDDLKNQIQDIFNSADEIIAYNINFDKNFLSAAGIKFSSVKQTDVMMDFAPIYGEYNEKFGTYKWQKLSTCASYYGYEFNAHDSLEDVKATLFCYNKMME